MNPPKEQAAPPDPATSAEQRQEIASPAPEAPYDPIENAMGRHRGLTREKAEEMAEAFGF